MAHPSRRERELGSQQSLSRKSGTSRSGSKGILSKLLFDKLTLSANQLWWAFDSWGLYHSQGCFLISKVKIIKETKKGYCKRCDKMLCVGDMTRTRRPTPSAIPSSTRYPAELPPGGPGCWFPGCLSLPPAGRQAGRMFTLAGQGPLPAWNRLNKHTRSQAPASSSLPSWLSLSRVPPPHSGSSVYRFSAQIVFRVCCIQLIPGKTFPSRSITIPRKGAK